MWTKVFYGIVKILIVIGMLLGLAMAVYLIVIVSPIVDQFFMEEESKPRAFAVLSMGIGLLCVAGAEYIAAKLLCMMFTLDSDPFVIKNVRALRSMGWTAMAIMLLGLSTLLLHPQPLAVLLALPIGMCGMFSLVLSGVFERAVACKLENDLTV